MARRSAAESEVETRDLQDPEVVNDIYQELMAGTQAHLISDTAKGVLHDRSKVPTPLPHLNALFGGGIPLGTIVEAYGEPACFTGDTLLMLSNGDQASLAYLYDCQRTNLQVYNRTKAGDIVSAQAESIYLAKYTDELMEIEFGDKYVIRCTPDHPFLTKGYEYIRADSLKLTNDIATITYHSVPSYSDMKTPTGKSVSVLNTVMSYKIQPNYLQPTAIKSVKLDQPVPVYGVLNAGECHNYAIALTDTLGVFVSNSGKSSFAYKMMGEFQKLYPKGKGVCIIVDTEASVDSTRMSFLGCDPNYMLRIPSSTVEKGFEQLYTILDKKVDNPTIKDLPVFILWDTIGSSVTAREMGSTSMNAEGMFGHGKLIKNQLSKLIPRIETQPIIVVLLNQVYTSTDVYGHSKLVSGGGYGIKHFAHLRFQFKSGKDEGVDDLFVTNRYSDMDVIKSKLSPLFKGINMVIDITKGGSIDPVKSMMEFSKRLGLFTSSGNRWKLNADIFQEYPQFDHKFDYYNSDGKSYYWNTYVEAAQQRPKIIKLLQLIFIKMISEHYSYQAEICKPYADQLIKEMEEPEYFTREDGSVVDLWTGEVLQASTTEAADFLQTQLGDFDDEVTPTATEDNQ